jgi:hypothetical protein
MPAQRVQRLRRPSGPCPAAANPASTGSRRASKYPGTGSLHTTLRNQPSARARRTLPLIGIVPGHLPWRIASAHSGYSRASLLAVSPGRRLSLRELPALHLAWVKVGDKDALQHVPVLRRTLRVHIHNSATSLLNT